ncbi:hypothetical protein [uncultured Nostoc sp.]|uniref:hypothetical protein n=1 Tax=uncultured Nostoc sp. TaxID=340711 RepID=UPI0035C954C8
MSYIKGNDENITIFLSIGEIIEYEVEDGYVEGQVLEVDESSNAVKVLPLSGHDLIVIPTWISGEQIISYSK